jgi:hypothetical protein
MAGLRTKHQFAAHAPNAGNFASRSFGHVTGRSCPYFFRSKVSILVSCLAASVSVASAKAV